MRICHIGYRGYTRRDGAILWSRDASGNAMNMVESEQNELRASQVCMYFGMRVTQAVRARIDSADHDDINAVY